MGVKPKLKAKGSCRRSLCDCKINKDHATFQYSRPKRPERQQSPKQHEERKCEPGLSHSLTSNLLL
jgi:hypothetical protein